ncbi:MAG: TNT domain-containing protein [Anaerofustis sp.]
MGFLTGTVFGGAESVGDTELMRMNEQFASVKKSGNAYGVDDGTIRKMQDASVRSDINVSFTEEASHYDAAEKRVCIDRNARSAAAEFSNVVRDNLNAIREGRNPDSAHNLYRLSKQTSDMVAGGKAYTREQLAKFTDKQLGAVLNVMRYRYMEGMSAKRQKLYLEMTSKLKTYEKRHTIASEQEGLGLRLEGDAPTQEISLSTEVNKTGELRGSEENGTIDSKDKDWNQNKPSETDVVETAVLLKKSTCTKEELEKYLSKHAGADAAEAFRNNGVWVEGLQIPKDSSVLRSDGGINWDMVPKGGYELDSNGEPIKQIYYPEKGEIIDRYGSAEGRYTCPVIDGKPFVYDQRSLPFIEDARQYHQYEVTGDFSKIEEYVRSCGNQQMEAEILEYIDVYYEGDFNNIIVYKGKIERIERWGEGGGIQYELPMKVQWLLTLGLLQEIK